MKELKVEQYVSKAPAKPNYSLLLSIDEGDSSRAKDIFRQSLTTLQKQIYNETKKPKDQPRLNSYEPGDMAGSVQYPTPAVGSYNPKFNFQTHLPTLIFKES